MTDAQEDRITTRPLGVGMTDEEWAERINDAFGQGVGWIIATGRQCMACRQQKGEEGWKAFADSGQLQFKSRQAQTFMRIAMQAELLDQSRWPVLPHAIKPLYQLTRLSDGMLPKLIEHGFIHPDMTEDEAKPAALAKQLNALVAMQAKEQKANGPDIGETWEEFTPEQKPTKRKRRAQQKTEAEKQTAAEKKEQAKVDKACDALICFIDGHHNVIAGIDVDVALNGLNVQTSKRLYKLADEACVWWLLLRRRLKPKNGDSQVTTRFKVKAKRK